MSRCLAGENDEDGALWGGESYNAVGPTVQGRRCLANTLGSPVMVYPLNPQADPYWIGHKEHPSRSFSDVAILAWRAN